METKMLLPHHREEGMESLWAPGVFRSMDTFFFGPLSSCIAEDTDCP
jgi:hypothetical protein